MALMENLPYPRVHYPSNYGSFIGFQQTPSSPIAFCSCSCEAMDHYVQFRLSKPIPQNSNPLRMHVLDPAEFPASVVRELADSGAHCDKHVIDYLRFEHKICHECNRIVPAETYCHPMYRGIFKQKHGWYINGAGRDTSPFPDGLDKSEIGNVSPKSVDNR